MSTSSCDIAPAVEVQLFGLPAIKSASGTTLLAPHRPHQLLALLACRSHGLPRAELAELFWPDRPEGAARGNLRVLLQRVQQGPVRLELQAERVRWPVATDLAAFEQAVAAGRDDEALALYQPPLLGGLEPGLPEPLLEWLEHERQRLDELWRGLVRRRVAAAPGAEAERLSTRLEQRQPGAADAEDRLAAAAARSDPDAFIGRRAELAMLAQRLRGGSRAIVVLGPGGVGKTALLRAALAECGPALFDHQAVFVSLADLGDAAQVPARIALALALVLPSAGEAWSQLARALGPRQLLLALDNTEQLEGLDTPLATLLQACPGLRMLIGSRRRPELDAALLPLEGLPLPDGDEGEASESGDDLDELRRFDAVRLFEARARDVCPGFTLGADTTALRAVLRATEGLPLALELAAAATRYMPLADVAAELARSLAVLGSGSSRGLQACFERSWVLLDGPGRSGLARLAWLPGDFSRAMAERVAAVRLPGVAALVDRSLLRADRQGRLSLHPLLRQYLLELHPLEDEPTLAERHAEFVDHLLLGIGSPQGALSASELRMLEEELPHVRAAWAWTVAANPPLATARLTRLARRMGTFYVERGGAQEILPWLQQAVQQINLPGRSGLAARAITLRTLAMLHYHRGALELAQQQARQALRWASQAGDTATALGCLTVLGNALHFAGQHEAAWPHFVRAWRTATQRQDRSIAAAAANSLGMIERARGRFDEALVHYRECRRLAAEMGDSSGQATALINMGNLQMLAGRWDEARQTNESALALAQAAGLTSKLAILHTILADIATETGRRGDARQHLAQAREWLDRGLDSVVPTQLPLIQMQLELAEGQPAAAVAALAEGVAAARDSQSTTMQLSAVNAAGELWAALGSPDEAGRLWQSVLQHESASASLRQRAEQLLRALPQPPEPPPALPLPDLLAALLVRLDRLAAPAGAGTVLIRPPA